MLHTVVPLDVVFAAEPPKFVEEAVGSARLVWSVDGSQRRLSRVISTDLRDFLKYELR